MEQTEIPCTVASTESASESNIEEHSGSSTEVVSTEMECNEDKSKAYETCSEYLLLKSEVQNQRLGVLQDGKYMEQNREQMSRIFEIYKNMLENLDKNLNHIDSKESQFDVIFKQIMKESAELNHTFIKISILSGILSDTVTEKNSLQKRQNELNHELEDLDNKTVELKENLSTCLQEIDKIKADKARYEKLRVDSLVRNKPIFDEWQKQKLDFEYLTQKLNELQAKQNFMSAAEAPNV